MQRCLPPILLPPVALGTADGGRHASATDRLDGHDRECRRLVAHAPGGGVAVVVTVGVVGVMEVAVVGVVGEPGG